jgi:hypothetical protein
VVWPEAEAHTAPVTGSLARLKDGETQRSIARSYNVSQATISRLQFETDF